MIRPAIFFDAVRIEWSLFRRKLLKKKLLKSIFRFVAIFALLFIIGFVLSSFSDMDSLSSAVEAAGVFGPLIIIGFIIVEVIFAPIPGTFIMVAAGALFGTWLGALYAYIGNILGSLLAFYLAKRFGRHLVKRLVSEKLLVRYDGFFLHNKKWLLLFYALPIIPVDILSFVCGLSALRFKKFFLVIVLGFIPNTLLLAFLGERLAGLGFLAMLFYTLIFLVVFSFFAWLFRLLVSRSSKKTI